MRTEPPNGDEFARLLASMRAEVIEQTADEPLPRREPRVRNTVLGALAAVALLLGLGTGAAFAFGLWPDAPGTEAPVAHATPSAAPSAEPSPADEIEQERYTAAPAPEPLPAAIEISADRLVVVADDGSELAAFSYFDDADAVVAVLTELLGEPVASEVQSRGDGFTGTRYEWDGFALSDNAFPSERPYSPDYGVSARATIVEGLTLRTAAGVGTDVGVVIGDSASNVQTEEPWSHSDQIDFTRIGISDDLPPHPVNPDAQTPYNFGVGLSVENATGLVVGFGAPSSSWGP